MPPHSAGHSVPQVPGSPGRLGDASAPGGRLGTDTIERIRALHTPLQQTTVGSGLRLSTQT